MSHYHTAIHLQLYDVYHTAQFNVSFFPGCDTESLGEWSPTFRDSVVVSSTVEWPMNNNVIGTWSLQMKLLRCFETSGDIPLETSGKIPQMYRRQQL